MILLTRNRDGDHIRARVQAGHYSVSGLIAITRSTLRSDATRAHARYAAGCGMRRNQSAPSSIDSIQT